MELGAVEYRQGFEHENNTIVDNGLSDTNLTKDKAGKFMQDEEDEEMEDLFGDDGNIVAPPRVERLSSPEAAETREGSEALSASELKHRKELEYEEDDDQEGNVVELKHAMLSIPNIPMPKGSGGKTWVIRMPNYVKLDSRPFSKATYSSPEAAIDAVGDQERNLGIKLEVENTIRWRWTKDEHGLDKRESNSRVVRWSDGSMSLLLGKELFDINYSLESAPAQGSQTSASQNQSQSQKQSQSQNTTPVAFGRGSGLTYLVAQHKRPGILQAEAAIAGTMTLRPTGMHSEAHRKLARAVGQKHSRVARLRIAPDSIAQEVADADKLEKKTRKQRKSTADRDGFGVSSRRRNTHSSSRRRESVWSDDDEPEWADEEEDAGSPARRRNSGEGARDTDIGKGGDYQTDDFLVADSSEDEGSARRKKSKKGKYSAEGDDEGGADSLDELDARIAEQEASRRRKREEKEDKDDAQHGKTESSQEPHSEGDVEMDVESEEEEEEFSVRRTGRAGGNNRKKRAIAVEDEED